MELERSCEEGNARSCSSLGMITMGVGAWRDHKPYGMDVVRSARALSSACLAGETKSCEALRDSNLTYNLSRGSGALAHSTALDFLREAAWHERACLAGYDKACLVRLEMSDLSDETRAQMLAGRAACPQRWGHDQPVRRRAQAGVRSPAWNKEAT